MSALVAPADTRRRATPVCQELRCGCGKLLAAHFIPGRYTELVIRCSRCGEVTRWPERALDKS